MKIGERENDMPNEEFIHYLIAINKLKNHFLLTQEGNSGELTPVV